MGHGQAVTKISVKTRRGLLWTCVQAGRGDAVLLIHGLGGAHQFWLSQIAFLSSGYQVIAVDLPGHGESAWMPLSVHDLAVDLRQILSHLGAEHVSVVASSMGGLIAWELYRMMADDIMRMSFVGSLPKFARTAEYPAGLDIERIRDMSRQCAPLPHPQADTGQKTTPILEIFFRSLFTMYERNEPHFLRVRDVYASIVKPQGPALAWYLDILEKTDLRDRLAGAICPLQFVTGSEDYICSGPIMDWVRDHCLNARLDFMPLCGHLPFLSQPKEYNALLESFLLQ